VKTLGTIYSSSLFPGRAPPGRQLLLNYIGGATNRGIVDQSPEQLVEQVPTLCCRDHTCLRRAAVAAESAQQMANVCRGWAGSLRRASGVFLPLTPLATCCWKTTAAAERKPAWLPIQVDKDLRTMLVKPDAPAPQMVGVRVWPRAIPQFNVGHLDTLEVCLVARC
jgi:Flavin containing amine oxidoreductase